MSKSKLAEYVAKLEAELETTAEFMTPDDRALILAHLTRLQEILGEGDDNRIDHMLADAVAAEVVHQLKRSKGRVR